MKCFVFVWCLIFFPVALCALCCVGWMYDNSHRCASCNKELSKGYMETPKRNIVRRKRPKSGSGGTPCWCIVKHFRKKEIEEARANRKERKLKKN